MKEDKEEDKVPVFKSWRAWYILSISVLLFLILFFFILTALFNE